MKMKCVLGVFLAFIVLAFAQESKAALYLRPKAGILIDESGDTTSTLGIKTGYSFTDYLAISADYTYVDRAVDQNLLGVSGTVFIPLVPVVSPFVSLGTILYPSDSNVVAGAGVAISPPFIDMLSIGVGLDYYHYFDAAKFYEVYAVVGLRF